MICFGCWMLDIGSQFGWMLHECFEWLANGSILVIEQEQVFFIELSWLEMARITKRAVSIARLSQLSSAHLSSAHLACEPFICQQREKLTLLELISPAKSTFTRWYYKNGTIMTQDSNLASSLQRRSLRWRRKRSAKAKCNSKTNQLDRQKASQIRIQWKKHTSSKVECQMPIPIDWMQQTTTTTHLFFDAINNRNNDDDQWQFSPRSGMLFGPRHRCIVSCCCCCCALNNDHVSCSKLPKSKLITNKRTHTSRKCNVTWY